MSYDSKNEKSLGITPLISETARVVDTQFGKYCEVAGHTSITESQVGDYSYIMNNCHVIYTKMGRFCSIAAYVRLNPGQHPLDHAALHHFTYRSSQFGMGEDHHAFFEDRRANQVCLGHDVWIGHGAVVMPGIKIGTGAVIGSGSIVTHDVDPFTIVAGSPARKIRHRFPEQIREALMEICWWDWKKQKIENALQDFRHLTASEFVKKHG